MDIEQALISKIVNDRCFAKVVEVGVTVEHLLDDQHREVFTMITKHFTTYGRSISADAFRQNNPSYKLLTTPEPIEWYVEQVREQRRATIASEMTADLIDAVEAEDLESVVRVTSIGLRAITAEAAVLSDHNVPQEWESRIATYEEWHEHGNTMRGIPTGYESFDLTTRGLQSGNLITIAGPPGVGKTTLALSMAKMVHEEGYKVIFVSFEMPYEELAARYDSQRAGINHHRLLGGKLGKNSLKRLRKAMEQDVDAENFIITEDISQMTTVSALQAKVQQYKPDLLVVDGVYMMQDENGEAYGSPQAMTNISRGLAMMCKAEKIPVVITTQALLSKMRGGRVTLGSIGYTSAFAQDSHVVIGLSVDPDDADQAMMDTLKSRNGPQVAAFLEWNWHQARFLEVSSDYINHDDDKEEEEEDEPQRKVYVGRHGT